MNVSFLFYMSQEKSHKKSYHALEAYGLVEKTLNWSSPQKKKYKEINFTIWFFF